VYWRWLPEQEFNMELNQSNNVDQALNNYLSESAARKEPSNAQNFERYAELWSKARCGIENKAHSLQTEIRKQPFAAVLGVLALGMVVGALTGRRR
jgi:hypothetical protein